MNKLSRFFFFFFEWTHSCDFLPFSLPLSPDLHLLSSLRPALILRLVTDRGTCKKKKTAFR